MPSAGFEPTISVDEGEPNYVLDRAATGIGMGEMQMVYISYEQRIN